MISESVWKEYYARTLEEMQRFLVSVDQHK